MILKPFNFAQAQEAYLKDKWTPEFYEGVERMVGMKNKDIDRQIAEKVMGLTSEIIEDLCREKYV